MGIPPNDWGAVHSQLPGRSEPKIATDFSNAARARETALNRSLRRHFILA
jgi:hypothetical protein